ncbi:MAG TPA: S-adenosylmethionine decarboxylase [Pyrinomonadaceae bacterium]|nr:S-adenosylmethionine decarboxylase [Pyrinomonadaceae bacterium]
MIVGTEWLIEAGGCDPAALRDQGLMTSILSAVIDDLGLRSVGSVWHKFDGEGGVTGMIALTESHLTCHTYPEYGTATFNLYCCRTRPEWDWDTQLKSRVRATTIAVRKVERGTGGSEVSHLKFEIAGGTK